MKRILLGLFLVSCLPNNEASNLQASRRNPAACVLNKAKTELSKIQNGFKLPPVPQGKKAINFNFKADNIVQGAKNFCKDGKCVLNFRKNVRLTSKVPVGVGNSAVVFFEQNKMHKGCKRSVTFFGRFGNAGPQVCIGNILKTSSTVVVGASHTPGQGVKSNVSVTGNLGGKVGPVVAEATVGGKVNASFEPGKAPSISAKMTCDGKAFCDLPFLKMRALVDREGIEIEPWAQVNVADTKVGTVSVINREDLGGVKKYKWKDIKQNCGAALCTALDDFLRNKMR